MLKEFKNRYRRELLQSVIPFWMRHSLDPEHGGYFTCLDRDGSIYDTRKYVWMQGRQAWMLGKLYNEVEKRPEWLDASRSGVEFLRRHARDPQGRYYFSLTRDGKPAFFQRKPYSPVFAVLALLEYSKTGAGEQYLREAVELFWKIREWIANPALLDRPTFAGQTAYSQMADIMVVASMALELSTVHDDRRYLAVMEQCVESALRHLHPERRTFQENILADGTRADTPEGRLCCPGHSLEVAWFLLQILDRLPDAAIERKVIDSIEGALELGWDGEFGGLYYFLDLGGKPPMQLEANMKLWWAHTEAIYALILAYTRTREARWLPWLEKVDAYSFQHFADPQFGEWYGYCDRRGDPTHLLKGGPYKGCFHVPRFLLLSVQAIEKFEAGS
jgi:N-acylglucosamine 2-epimerase